MAKDNNIRRPKRDDYVLAEQTPDWLNTPSPFEQLDEMWIEIIIFYVFHVPVSDLSARARSLDYYGWGTKSRNNDFKQLKGRLIKYGNISNDHFKCEETWVELKEAYETCNLYDNFPKDITCERVAFKKNKSGENDSLLSHIRHSFSHGRLTFFDSNKKIYVAMEDIDKNNHVSARMILSKKTLLRWKIIIENGPRVTEEELEKLFKSEEKTCPN